MAPMAHPLGLPDSDMLSSRRPRLQVKGHDSRNVTAFLFVLQESSSYRYLIGKILNSETDVLSKQNKPRSNCSHRSSLIWVYVVFHSVIKLRRAFIHPPPLCFLADGNKFCDFLFILSLPTTPKGNNSRIRCK